MNGKANKQQIQFPPLLNLANDKPHIDSTFKNWEKNNAPYLNDMISPTYIKENGTEGIYDNKGRKHQIIDGTWYVDGVAKGSDYNYKFNRTVLDSNYLAYDFDNNNELAYVWYDDYKLYSSNGTNVEITDLASESDIIDIRLKCGGASFITVMLYKTPSGLTKISVIEWSYTSSRALRVNERAIWSKQTITANEPSWTNDIQDPGSIDPVIHIAQMSDSRWVYSIFSNYGEAVNSRYNYYISYYDHQRVNSVALDSDVSYMKKVWYRGTYTATSSATNNTTIDQAVKWSRNLSDDYVHFWVYVYPEEESAAGISSGYYPIYNCNPNLINNATGMKAMTQAYIDTEARRDSLPFSPAVDETTDATLHLLNIDTSQEFGIITSASLYKTYRNSSYDASTYIVSPVISVITDSNTLIENESIAITLKYDTENGNLFADVPEGWTYETEGSFIRLSTTVNLGDGITGVSIPITQRDDDSFVDYVNADWTLPDGSETTNTNSLYINYETRQAATLQSSDVFCLPCVFLDNGKIYNFSAFTQSTTSLVLMNKTIGIMTGSGYSFNNNVLTVDTIEEMFDLDDSGVNGKWTIRSNSFICQQNYIAQMYKFTLGTISPANLTAGNAENNGAYNIEIYNSNVTDLKVQPGSSRYTGFNYYGDFLYNGSTSGAPEDRLIYCTIGARTKVNPNDDDNCFNVLLNTTTDNTCYFQGISWANGDDIGTLLTPWQEVSEDFYIVSKGNKCLYKNKYDELILLERVDGSSLMPVNNNKFIICNTDNYWNLFDSERGQWFHYASDWNFRVLGGYEGIRALSSTESVSNTHRMYFADAYTFWFRNIGASVNNTIARTASRTNFSNPNIYPVASWQTPVYAKARLYVDELSLYGANEPSFSNAELLGVDVYYTKYPNVTTSGIGDAYYQYTYISGNKRFKSNLNGVTYIITSSSTMFLNPSLLATYLDGAGNNDLIRDLKEYYTQNYYNNKPTFIYAVSSEVNGADAFFVIQGQFYAIIENKICSVSYSDSVLTSKDPIIDINGMKFLGNNPMIAFFWSERYKAFYSFTGDASLEILYPGSKFSNGISGDHYYDYSTQTIYVPTDRGLLCFGPKNTYILERFKNTTNVQFTDDNITHITDNGNDYSLVYYPEDDYEVYNVNLESSFFGIGATELTSIDRWNITLYDLEGTHPAGEVKYGVRSITDITVKSEDKTLKITPDMWDKWSNSILIAFNPKLIKGQGLRLYVDSPFIIQQITAHVMDDGTGTTVNRKASV